MYGFDGVAVYDETSRHRWAYQATRGGADATVEVSPTVAIAKREDDFLLDIFDELDAKLAAGGDRPGRRRVSVST